MTARPAPLDDLLDRYAEYQGRVTAALGELKPGAFGKYGGHLIKQLAFDEFARAHVEYAELIASYRASLERGDTINDPVIKQIREQAASLILPTPRL